MVTGVVASVDVSGGDVVAFVMLIEVVVEGVNDDDVCIRVVVAVVFVASVDKFRDIGLRTAQ